ncbi:MAG: hypothetical protein AB2L14_07535 [Candidatus Xenobiia bacterium LiM19]
MLSKIFRTLSKSNPGSQTQSALYHYEIKDREGKSIKGEIRARTLKEALRKLEKRSATIVSLEKSTQVSLINPGRLKTDDLLFIFRELSVLMECGRPHQKSTHGNDRSGKGKPYKRNAQLHESVRREGRISF